MINVYVCEGCGYRHVTINKDTGVTPFLIGCRNPNSPVVAPSTSSIRSSTGCGHLARSSMYRVDQSLAAEFEWYGPNKQERAGLDPQSLQHVESGGLLLRAFGAEVADPPEVSPAPLVESPPSGKSDKLVPPATVAAAQARPKRRSLLDRIWPNRGN